MKKQNVALFYSESLLGESLQILLGKLVDVHILGPWALDDTAPVHLDEQTPDVIVIADESIGEHDPHSQQAGRLVALILEKHVGVPVVQVLLAANQVRIYNSHTVPARGSDLIEAIRNLGIQAENVWKS